MNELSENIKIIEFKYYTAIFDKADLSLNLYPQDQFHDKMIRKNIVRLVKKFPEINDSLKNLGLKYFLINKNSDSTNNRRPSLHRLSINVSNLCNLACRYCYANEGEYYTGGRLMDKSTAINAVAFVFSNFDYIHHINFFGGEPTLNEPIIELIYKYVKLLQSKGVISYFPSFGITTNGYILSDKMLEMIRDYNFSTCISLDGPNEIHDKLRIGKCGQNTHSSVVSNINRIKNSNISPEFECTYTREHFDNGISLIKLMDYFYDNFGCRILHCPLVVCDSCNDLYVPYEQASKIYSDAIHYSIHNLTNGIPKTLSFVVRILNSLDNKKPITDYCSAGESLIAINADGKIFPCFMLMDQENYCLGNVNDEKANLSISNSLIELLLSTEKCKNESCKMCWAQPLCFGCLGEDIARGNIGCRSSIYGNSNSCDFKRSMIEATLKSIAEFKLAQNIDDPDVSYNNEK